MGIELRNSALAQSIPQLRRDGLRNWSSDCRAERYPLNGADGRIRVSIHCSNRTTAAVTIRVMGKRVLFRELGKPKREASLSSDIRLSFAVHGTNVTHERRVTMASGAPYCKRFEWLSSALAPSAETTCGFCTSPLPRNWSPSLTRKNPEQQKQQRNADARR